MENNLSDDKSLIEGPLHDNNVQITYINDLSTEDINRKFDLPKKIDDTDKTLCDKDSKDTCKSDDKNKCNGNGDKLECDKEEPEINRYVKDERCKHEIFTMYVIIVIIIFMLIFLIVIRGFIIPVIDKNWFFPAFLLSIFYILTTILVVGYENHIKTEHSGLRTFLIFYLIAQSILLVLIISQFFTHGNVKSTSVMSGVLTLMILIWFLLSYNSRVRFTLLIYALIMALFTYLMATTIKRFD